MANYGGGYMNDLLIGGPDADVLWGGMGEDTLQGGAGNDRLIGGPDGDKLEGGPGNEDIASYTQSPSGVHVDLSTSFTDNVDQKPATRGGDAEGDVLTGIESIWGSGFGDILLGNHSPNSLFGNAGDDIIHGGGGNDLLRGGADNDRLGGEAIKKGDGTFAGTDETGNDTMYGDEGNDQLQGGTGLDMLFGGMGDDELQGGSGDDFLEGGPGADALVGGTGMDTAAYTMSSEAVTVDLRFGEGPGSLTIKAPMGGDAVGDTFVGIENLRGSMYGDMLIGDNTGMAMEVNDASTPDVDETTSRPGNTLFGNMGDDMLKGMGGNDTLRGGKGNDTLYGGADNDKLMGEMGDDAIKGDDGMDTLIGGEGADKLFGGSVVMEGGEPVPMPDESMDTVDYSGSDAGVKVNLGAFDKVTGEMIPTAEGGHAEGDSLHDIENLIGSSHADLLMGDGESNVLKGGMGDDWDNSSTPDEEAGLFGGAGDDTLEGGAGNDWLDGGPGKNYILGGSGDDMLIGGEIGELYEEAKPAVVADTEADVAAEEAVGVQKFGLFGGSGADTLRGGDGGDTINGGTGRDTADYSDSPDLGNVPISYDYDGAGNATEVSATGVIIKLAKGGGDGDGRLGRYDPAGDHNHQRR